MDQVKFVEDKFFNGCLLQSLLGPCLNNLSHLILHFNAFHADVPIYFNAFQYSLASISMPPENGKKTFGINENIGKT